jgi:hypothetical protein
LGAEDEWLVFKQLSYLLGQRAEEFCLQKPPSSATAWLPKPTIVSATIGSNKRKKRFMVQFPLGRESLTFLYLDQNCW